MDRLKEINDAFGRAAGNSVIVEFTNRLRDLAAVESTIGRLFSDEFCLITDRIASADDADVFAAAVQAALRRPHGFGARLIHANASIGIALYPDDGASADALLDAADAALNRAKLDGGNVMRMYSREFADQVRSRRLLHDDLSRALARDEFFLQYQPIVDLGSGELRMAEALVRWRSGDRGIVPPGDFIPLAEQSDLMVSLGRWVIEEAVRGAHLLRDDGRDVQIAVNVSARQLHDAAFFEHLSGTVAAAGLVPDDFELEVTETAAMADASVAYDVLTRCSAAGFGVALDDFGTHFSSLTYLKRLPVDTVKIDRSFVQGLPSNVDDAAIVGGIISLVKSLGRRPIAEGVESLAQSAWLSRAGCETGQGYLYARPMALQDLRAWHAPTLPEAV
jgi:diguanylate cyclase (GGDEF)-like protein